MCPVNSHNEWDKLEEVIVGNGFPTEFPIDDNTFKFIFHDNLYDKNDIDKYGRWILDKKYSEEQNEDLNKFSDFLKNRNITVKRPKLPMNVNEIKTNCWSSCNYPALNVRDLTMIVGNEIIEIPILARWRQFENDYLRHLYLEYFKQGAKWTCAPRPLAVDESIDFSRINKCEDFKEHFILKNNYLGCGVEMAFDAANCMRLGDKILFNAPTEHERLGAQWLQQHLGSSYEIWVTNFFDNHIDSVFLPIKPGLAVITLPIIDKLPKPLQSWDFIQVPAIIDPDKALDYTPLASEKIFCNLLNLSKEEVICQPEYYNILSPKLKPYGVDVIPFRLRHSRLFGGGHHCLTLDIRRNSNLESYF